MAAKTANVLARVEPETKEKAEAILDRLGVPASVVINMLYKQIIAKQGIPFPIVLPAPLVRDEMDDETFKAMMVSRFEEVKRGEGRTVDEVFTQNNS